LRKNQELRKDLAFLQPPERDASLPIANHQKLIVRVKGQVMGGECQRNLLDLLSCRVTQIDCALRRKMPIRGGSSPNHSEPLAARRKPHPRRGDIQHLLLVKKGTFLLPEEQVLAIG